MKKTVLIALGAVVIVAAVVAMFVFVLSGDNTASPQSTVSLNGTWKVVSNVIDSTATLPENEYIVFDDSSAKLYRDDLEAPLTSSSYTIDASGTMSLPDISRSYIFSTVTDNIIKLAESKTSIMYLVRYSDDMTSPEFDAALLNGTWNVVCHASNTLINETIVFENNTMKDYRDGNPEPAITADYSVTNNKISVNSLGLELICCEGIDGTLFMIQENDGLVWELARAD